MKKKIILLIFGIVLLLSNIKPVSAENACTKEAAQQLAKIMYHEVGWLPPEKNPGYEFMCLTTGSVVINNSKNKPGDTWYQKIYNLTDGNYQNYSKYKDRDIKEDIENPVVRSRMLYFAELILNGYYNVPRNIYYQAAQYILVNGGVKEWTHEEVSSGYDVYFGTSSIDSIKEVQPYDVFGDAASTDPDYYRELALKYKLSDYSKYTVDTVCNGLSQEQIIIPGNSNKPGSNEEIKVTTIEDACLNPEVLKVIYFITILLDIIRIAIPIGLIVFGTIDLSKAVASNKEGEQKKNLKTFGKRILFALLVFFVPWIVETLMISLGSLTENVNFTDCLKNANSDTIAALESKIANNNECYYCKDIDSYVWAKEKPGSECASGWKTRSKYITAGECAQGHERENACYYCAELNEYRWTNEKPTMYCSVDKDWVKRNDMDEGECLKQDSNSCYYCAADDIYLWREKIPELYCSQGSWKRKPGLTKEECK